MTFFYRSGIMNVLKENKPTTEDKKMTTTHKTSEGRGHWVKNGSDYNMNAVESCSEHDAYIVTITKENGRWIVYAEDHNPEDISFNPANGFKTLTEAKAFAEDFAEYFEHCLDEIAESEAAEEEITGYIVANVWGKAIAKMVNFNTYLRGVDIINATVFTLEEASQWLNELGEDWFIQPV